MRSRFLNEREIESISRYMTREDWLPFAIALDTGLRVGDVVKIEWKDVQGNRITFVAEKTRKKGVAYVEETTARILWQRRRQSSSKWVFPSPCDSSRHITRQSLWKRLKAACRRARVPSDGISPHSFRKVYGVREYRTHGISAAQAGLQHTDIGTTEIYVLSDWLTAENGDKPLLRSDMARILHYIADWLGIPRKEPPRS